MRDVARLKSLRASAARRNARGESVEDSEPQPKRSDQDQEVSVPQALPHCSPQPPCPPVLIATKHKSVPSSTQRMASLTSSRHPLETSEQMARMMLAALALAVGHVDIAERRKGTMPAALRVSRLRRKGR